MNQKMIRFIIGRVLLIFSMVLCLPLIVAFIYHEDMLLKISWIVAISISFGFGFGMTYKKPENTRFHTKEGILICAILWLSLAFIGSLPLYISHSYPTMADAYFEIASGLTTTGSSVHPSVESLSHSVLFWRSFTHLIGGMGVLVFVLALSTKSSKDSLHVMRAEVPGPTFDKIVSKLSETARILYLIYLSMTAILIVLLLLGGMPLFDSICHAFGTAGTGGFGVKNSSIAYYDSTYIHLVLSLGMIAFGINFNLYYLLLLRKVRNFIEDEELHVYLAIIAIAVVLISLNVLPYYENIGIMLRDVFFTVSSIVTTTGFATVDFDKWPLFSHVIIMMLMIIGSCAGSTAGGLKVSRVIIHFKSFVSEFVRQREPNRIVMVNFNRSPVNKKSMQAIQNYFIAYTLIFAVLLLFVSFEAPDFETAFSTVAATFNNIGPGFNMIGPTGNFAAYSGPLKILLSFGMIAGRLELWPILILFSPKTWTRL